MEKNKKIEVKETEIFDNKMHVYGRISTSIIMLIVGWMLKLKNKEVL